MDDTRHDTKEFLFRKVIKDIDLLATPANQDLFTPRPGETFMVQSAFMRVRETAGTETDAANFQIDDGTDGNDIVASVSAISTEENAVQRLAVVGNFPLTQDKPLRLRYTDAAGGLTALKVDLIFSLMKISNIA